MALFSLFEKKQSNSAGAARDRLQLMIATQRVVVGDGRAQTSIDERLLYKIQAEIMLVLEKYVKINRDDVKIDVTNMGDNIEVLEVSIPIGEDRY